MSNLAGLALKQCTAMQRRCVPYSSIAFTVRPRFSSSPATASTTAGTSRGREGRQEGSRGGLGEQWPITFADAVWEPDPDCLCCKQAIEICRHASSKQALRWIGGRRQESRQVVCRQLTPCFGGKALGLPVLHQPGVFFFGAAAALHSQPESRGPSGAAAAAAAAPAESGQGRGGWRCCAAAHHTACWRRRLGCEQPNARGETLAFLLRRLHREP